MVGGVGLGSVHATAPVTQRLPPVGRNPAKAVRAGRWHAGRDGAGTMGASHIVCIEACDVALISIRVVPWKRCIGQAPQVLAAAGILIMNLGHAAPDQARWWPDTSDAVGVSSTTLTSSDFPSAISTDCCKFIARTLVSSAPSGSLTDASPDPVNGQCM